MKIKALNLLLICLLLSATACKKLGESSSGGSILGDDTEEAVKIVDDANNDLREIKKIYILNQGKGDEISAAINDKDIAKVKSIADDLVTEINGGIVLGEKAVSKIEEARSKNINSSFKQYLAMKSEALRMQLKAFGFRLEAAQVLRDGFGKADKSQISTVIAEFKLKDTNFKQLMEEGRNLSQQANVYAADELRKTPEKK